jgi:hypothetical protein
MDCKNATSMRAVVYCTGLSSCQSGRGEGGAGRASRSAGLPLRSRKAQTNEPIRIHAHDPYERPSKTRTAKPTGANCARFSTTADEQARSITPAPDFNPGQCFQKDTSRRSSRAFAAVCTSTISMPLIWSMTHTMHHAFHVHIQDLDIS